MKKWSRLVYYEPNMRAINKLEYLLYVSTVYGVGSCHSIHCSKLASSAVLGAFITARFPASTSIKAS